MSEPQLRRAVPADAPAVVEIHLRTRRLAMPYLPKLHSDDDVRGWIRSTLLEKAEVWIAEIEGAATGYMALVEDILDHLYVAPDQQGRGVGSLLLEKAKTMRPGGLRLYAFQRNHRARAFYEARGFTAVALSDGADNEEREPDVLYQWPARSD